MPERLCLYACMLSHMTVDLEGEKRRVVIFAILEPPSPSRSVNEAARA